MGAKVIISSYSAKKTEKNSSFPAGKNHARSKDFVFNALLHSAFFLFNFLFLFLTKKRNLSGQPVKDYYMKRFYLKDVSIIDSGYAGPLGSGHPIRVNTVLQRLRSGFGR